MTQGRKHKHNESYNISGVPMPKMHCMTILHPVNLTLIFFTSGFFLQAGALVLGGKSDFLSDPSLLCLLVPISHWKCQQFPEQSLQ